MAVAIADHHEAASKSNEVGRLVTIVCRTAGQCGLTIPSSITLLGKMLLNLDQVARAIHPGFDANEAIREHAAELVTKRLADGMTPTRLLGQTLAAKALAENLPNRLTRVLELISDNGVKLKVDAIDEDRLIKGFQKIANRIAMGLILSAMIVAGAMMMQMEGGYRLLGYPLLAILTFALAGACGAGFVIAVGWEDFWERRNKKR